MEHSEALWPGGPQYLYDAQCFPPSTDSFLLGSFPTLRRGEPVCDLGAGAGLLGLLLLLLLLLLLGRKTVHFETGCDSKVKDQKVKKGSLVTRPEQPVRPGRAFAGWYADESCTKRWDFDNDKVEDNMTLYAKWL